MVRRILFLALALLAVVGAAFAATDSAISPSANDDIGNIDGEPDAAPVGEPVPAGVFTTTTETITAPAPSPKGGAAALEIFAVTGVAAAVAVVFF